MNDTATRSSATLAYVDISAAGHHAEYMARSVQVCASLNIRMRACVPLTLWDRTKPLAGDAMQTAEHSVVVGEYNAPDVETRTAILAQVLAHEQAQTASGLFFPVLDEFLRPLFLHRRRGGSMLARWTGIFYRDGFNYFTQDVARPAIALKSLIRMIVLRSLLRDGATEIVTLNKGWRAAMPVPTTWLPDSLSSLDRMAAAASGSAGWPVPQVPPPEAGRVRFLLFGALKPRKGIGQTLKALAALRDDELAGIELQLLGRFHSADQYRLHILDSIEALVNRGAFITLTEGYTPETVLDAALRRCDVVLAPYVRHQGSSSVMVIAAQYGRPILGQRVYQVGSEMGRYDLGVTFDPQDCDAYAGALRIALARELSPTEGMRRFKEERAPERSFAVLQGIFRRLCAMD